MLTIQATGKSVDAAIYNGLGQLGLSIDEVNIEVIQRETKGILGIGAKPAIVKLTEKPKEEVVIPDFALERERRNERRDNRRDSRPPRDNRDDRRKQNSSEKTVRIKDAYPNQKPVNAAADGLDERTAEMDRRANEFHQKIVSGTLSDEEREAYESTKAILSSPLPEQIRIDTESEGTKALEPRENRENRRNNNRRQGGKNRGEHRRAPQIKAPEIEYSEEDAKNEPAAQFVSGLLEKMLIEGKVLSAHEDEAVRLRVDCGEMGVLIGHRGETLDAIQYLTSLVINRNRKTEGYTRVTINTEDYREKREETLIRLARRIASQVKATGSPRTLEPMNPYERRIIHSALQKHPYVTTHSEGDEPNRRVVVSPKRRQSFQKSNREQA